MAQTRCPQCSEEISDKVATCPRCGYLLAAPAAQVPSQNPQAGPGPAQSASASLGRDKPSAATASEERFRQIYAEKGVIHAIKYWREVTGSSLAQAKAFYDQERASGRLGETARRQKTTGCLVLWLLALLIIGAVLMYIVLNFALIHR